MTREKIQFKSNGHNLVGFIDYPDEVPAPGVITFHGGTNTKDICPCFPEVPEALVKNGYINMRFDFFGSGESDGLFQDKTNAELLQNMKDAIDFFANNKKVTKFGIMGRSQSGIQQACLYDERIICRVIQSPTIEIKEVFKYWYPNEFEEFMLHLEEKYLCITEGDTRKVKGPYCYGRTYMEEDAEVKRLAKIALPKISNVLIMQGNKDKEVEPEKSRELYDLLPKQKEYHIINGAGHGYQGFESEATKLALYWFDKFLK
jgi:uncharacterized protein